MKRIHINESQLKSLIEKSCLKLGDGGSKVEGYQDGNEVVGINPVISNNDEELEITDIPKKPENSNSMRGISYGGNTAGGGRNGGY